MANRYKLYGFPVSPFAALIHSALIYKKVDFEYESVDFRNSAQKHPEYLSLHPFGQVPLLITDKGQAIYESWAIFEYLEETFPEHNMLPKTEPERSSVRSLCFVILSGIIPSARDLFLESLGRHKLTDEARNATQQAVVAKLEVFARELEKLKNLPALTPIDALFYQAWQNVKLGFPTLKELIPSLEAYSNRIAAKPEIIAVESTPAIKQLKQAMFKAS